MKNLIFILASFIVALYASSVYARTYDKVVYGTDGRLEVNEAPQAFANWANSTAAHIPNSNIEEEGDDFRIKGETLIDTNRVCEGVKYANQIAPGRCSGFLVAPDVLVTAGHCMRTAADCSNNSWVFGFYADVHGDAKTLVKNNQVYKCSKVLSQVLDRQTNNDYAIVKLDRVVEGRTPLKFRTSGKVANNSDLIVIGNPIGLPTKVTTGGTLRKNDNAVFFVANLDTFGGNSGSAVFDSKSGLVEGILVRGETDFSYDSAHGCYEVNVCPEGACRGEDVTRITNLSQLISTNK